MNTPNQNAVVTAAGNAPRKKRATTNVRYLVRLAGQNSTSFAADRYSKWHKRFHRYANGEQIEIYGYDQAMEHIAELRHHVYEGRKIYIDSTFEIVKETTITETVASIPRSKSLRKQQLPKPWHPCPPSK